MWLVNIWCIKIKLKHTEIDEIIIPHKFFEINGMLVAIEVARM